MGKFYEACLQRLRLVARHLAWLEAAPTGATDKDKRSRRERFTAREDAGETCSALELPEAEAGAHLVGYLLKVGPGHDGAPITFLEIEAWTRMTGTVLTAWEAGALRSLSQAYMGEYFAASDPQRPAPYAAPTPLDRAAVDAKLRAAFDLLERQHAGH